MTMSGGARGGAPRLVTKILGFSFGVIALVLAAVFLLLSWQTRDRLTQAIAANMAVSQQRVADREAARQRDDRQQAATLAEHPTLKAAVDTYHSENSMGGATPQLLNTIRAELEKVRQNTRVPALAVTDVRGVILASTGVNAGDWRDGDQVAIDADLALEPVATVMARGDRVYLATVVPFLFGRDAVGDLILASPIDDGYARNLAQDAQADVVVLRHGRAIATSLPAALVDAIDRVTLPADGRVALEDDEYVVRRLLSVDAVDIFALGSVSAPVRAATAEAAWVLLTIGLGALLLAGAGSLWLARTVAGPIDALRRQLRQMADARDFERPLRRGGASVELDQLAETFDLLRAAVAAAEAESEAAYLGVIGTLAAALDARDPYTAGHSERVAHLSVAIGRAMQLSEDQLEVLHLGALLHDIGKIGVPDAILRKPGTLTDEEFEQIKLHPSLGARILKPLHFLSEHVAIVELHHEQPDGRGYPHGLEGHAIPLHARIVHVADAFDAMTTARAYRPGRPANEAMAELWRCAGASFDLEVVRVVAAMPVSALTRMPSSHGAEHEGAGASAAGALLPFRLRSNGSRARKTAG